jgi:DNA excision repair protein ERCC-4
MVRAEKNVTSALGEAYETRVIVLDTSKLPTTITVVTQEDIQGKFRDARSIGNNIHLVTSAYINFYQLAGPLYRYNSVFQGMNSTQYKAAATKIAKPLIADFVTMLKNDILLNGKAPDIPKIAIWQSEVGANGNVIEQIYNGGAIQAYVQLTSFSVQGLTGDLTLSTAGAFTPTSWGYTYAVDGNLVFAAEGWNWSPWWRGSSQTTYLLGFKLDGASATPSFLGSVDGYIINQYSLSVYEGHLRVATTVNTFWPVWEPVAGNNGVTILPQPVSTTNNSVHVLKIPTGNETKLTEVTSITDLGKPNERLTAVRFFNNICYVGKYGNNSATSVAVVPSFRMHSNLVNSLLSAFGSDIPSDRSILCIGFESCWCQGSG